MSAKQPIAILTTTAVIVTFCESDRRMTWGQFIDANSGGVSPVEFANIRTFLTCGKTYRGGGGAQPEWSIRRAS